MIYLIQSAGYDLRGNYIDLLKIGFTEDLSSSNRFSAYKMHNPTCKILYTIPEATIEDETRLHIFFKKYRFESSREWYSYESEILSYFQDHLTAESLGGLESEVKKIQESQISEKTRVDNELLDLYNETKLEFLRVFLSFAKYTDRMRYFCDNIESIESETREKIKSKSGSYGFYYDTLGPEKCIALNCQSGLLKSEYSRRVENDSVDIKTAIYSEFNIGERYLKATIKKRLGELYIDLGYKATPKATDLENYFEIKRCKITNKEAKKQEEAFEIIKRKEII